MCQHGQKDYETGIDITYYYRSCNIQPWNLFGVIKDGRSIMKKLIAFLVLVTVLFAACSHSHKSEVGDSMNNINNQYTSYITLNALSVYETGKSYFITIDDGKIIQKLAEFSPDRNCLRIQGFDLIKNCHLNQFLSINFNELTEKLGQPHVDIGSGFYIPSYITEDAYLICFELENDVIIDIIKRDLLANQIVNRISCTSLNESEQQPHDLHNG